MSMQPTPMIKVSVDGGKTWVSFVPGQPVAVPTTPSPAPLFSDDFTGIDYVIKDGQTSPNGKWFCKYAGYGSCGTKAGVFVAYPQSASGESVVNPDQSTSGTSACLVRTTQKFPNKVKISCDMKTVQQVANRTPNPWEVGWIMFGYVDEWHHYYLAPKPNGIEIGKKDNNSKLEQQIFLLTESDPKTPVGEKNHWDITIDGKVITVYKNGTKEWTVSDNTQSTTLAQGGYAALYLEDARVEWDNFTVNPL